MSESLLNMGSEAAQFFLKFFEGNWISIDGTTFGTFICTDKRNNANCKAGDWEIPKPAYENFRKDSNDALKEPDGYLSENNAIIRKNGWWNDVVGTDSYFAICFKRVIFN